MTRLLILGRSGQLARALAEAAIGRFDQVSCAGRGQADMAESGAVDHLIAQTRPTIVINAAAWTAVDAAETNEASALRVNADAAAEAAAACERIKARFVHVSTDYVFGGDGRDGPFCEDDEPAPVNAYGRTKLAGERAVAQANPRAAIVRTSGVFSGRGADFPSAIWRLARSQNALRVVADQLTTPSPADQLAEHLLAIADARKLTGIFHCAGAPGLSWAEFAEAAIAQSVFDGQRHVPVQSIATNEFPRPARRPRDSRLATRRLMAELGLGPLDWKAGLARACEVWHATE